MKLVGPFDVPEATARAWLGLPNPDGADNKDVLKRLVNGDDVTGEDSRRWVVDFGAMNEAEARRYAVPFAHVEQRVKPMRDQNKERRARELWWQFQRPRPEMRSALAELERFIATSEVAKHRAFVRLETAGTIAAGSLVVIAAEDNHTFGVLNSRPHVAWALLTGSSLEDRPRYNPTACFETFPFPRPTPEARGAVERAARHLDASRAHLLARGRTLTEVYNALEEARRDPSPTRDTYGLLLAHENLDKAVHEAYGWPHPLEEEAVLERLLALNLERAAEGGSPPAAEGEAVGA